MSAQDFQKVMGYLIRFPRETLREAESKIGPLLLNDKDRARLLKMEVDPLVRKFGHKMAFVRQRETLEDLPLTNRFIERPILDELYFNHFEPSRRSVGYGMLGFEFLDFILTNSKSLDILEKLPSFVINVLKYEHAKAFVLRPISDQEAASGLPSKSLLCHKLFCPTDLEFDIPSLDRKRLAGEENLEICAPKKMTLLFIACATPPYYRMFQVDNEINAFLMCQLHSPENWIGELPKAYSGMVQVGLCKSL